MCDGSDRWTRPLVMSEEAHFQNGSHPVVWYVTFKEAHVFPEGNAEPCEQATPLVYSFRDVGAQPTKSVVVHLDLKEWP